LLGNVRTVTLDADLNQLAAIALEQEHDVPVLDGAASWQAWCPAATF
jgi:hypothetical protein